jgi:hypothetical protein
MHSYKKLFICIILIILIFYLYKQYNFNEKFITLPESVSNISTMFNNGSIIANKMLVLNTLDISGNIIGKKLDISENIIGKNLNISGDISGNIRTKYINSIDASGIIFKSDISGIILPSIYRKYMEAGYLKVKAYGYKVPLYYGWNLLWRDGDVNADKIASRLMVYESINGRSINNVNNVGMDTREKQYTRTYIPTGDPSEVKYSERFDLNWAPRGLVLLPGYSARLFYKDIKSTNNDIFSSGVYNWITPINGRNVYLIHITLQEEGPSTHTFKCTDMENYTDNTDVPLSKYPTKMPGSNTDFISVSV